MGTRRRHGLFSAAALVVVAAACAALAAPALGKQVGQYAQRDLVSDVPGGAELLDPLLVNPWGLALPPTGGAAWVADNGAGVSTLYTGAISGSPVVKIPLTVSIPGEAPTGEVFNGTGGFVVSSATGSGPAFFLFSSEAGQITGWNPTASSTLAQPAFSLPGAIFKGLAIADTASGPRLYATDFHNGQVVVLDSTFHRVDSPDAFRDPAIPAGFAPFGIRTVNGVIVVTYAKQDAAAEDDVAGKGNGFVDIYDLAGNLLRRFASGAPLNSPWGIAQAPLDFGSASGALLIGNFGDGRINAFDPFTGQFLGALRDEHGQRLAIDGLWALEFGNGVTVGTRQTLLFTAGPADEAHGLFGELTAIPSG
jgi:uncharacterized protein (TIGR03118 family)